MLPAGQQHDSETIHARHRRHFISYVRGRIRILDRRGLEAAVCECYKVVRDEYDRLLG